MANTYPTDTDPQTTQLLVKLNRSAPAWRKLELVAQMNEAVRVLTLTGLRKRHPGASQEELNRRLADLVLGRGLADRVYGPFAKSLAPITNR